MRLAELGSSSSGVCNELDGLDGLSGVCVSVFVLLVIKLSEGIKMVKYRGIQRVRSQYV